MMDGSGFLALRLFQLGFLFVLAEVFYTAFFLESSYLYPVPVSVSFAWVIFSLSCQDDDLVGVLYSLWRFHGLVLVILCRFTCTLADR